MNFNRRVNGSQKLSVNPIAKMLCFRKQRVIFDISGIAKTMGNKRRWRGHSWKNDRLKDAGIL